jgi:tetratricopeptide (TPR) repeat protein
MHAAFTNKNVRLLTLRSLQTEKMMSVCRVAALSLLVLASSSAWAQQPCSECSRQLVQCVERAKVPDANSTAGQRELACAQDREKCRSTCVAVAERSASYEACDRASESEPEKRVELCTSAINDPQTSQEYRGHAYLRRSMAHSRLKNLSEAINDATAATKLHPKSHRPYLRRALAHEAAKKYAETEADYSEAIRLKLEDPEPTFANMDRAELYMRRGVFYSLRQQHRKALADFQRSIELGPSSQVYNMMGLTYRSLGDQKNSAASFRKAKTLEAKEQR